MLQLLPVSKGNTIAVRASGKLTHEDYQEFLPKLEKQIEDIGKTSILFELDNFTGWELEAAKDDFKFGMKHLDDLERFAVVGDKMWEHWMVLMVKPFMPSGKVRYFDRENLQEAWNWLREPEKLEASAKHIAPYQDITVAFDFSPYSKHAAQRGLELAERYNSKLTLLNIVQEILPYPSYYGDSITGYVYDAKLLAKQNKEQLTLAEDKLNEYISTLNAEIEIKPKVLGGDVKATILSYLEAQETDLVIFGAKKKTGIARLLGSTPRYIQNHARCETLIVPLLEERVATDV